MWAPVPPLLDDVTAPEARAALAAAATDPDADIRAYAPRAQAAGPTS